jgi:hypothetical protein
MLPWNRTSECPNFVISNWLFAIRLSTLSHSPSYLVSNLANRRAGNRIGYSLSYLVRNSESYLGGYRASYRSGYLPENSASSGEDCRDSNSADSFADCPDNRPERNPESNLVSNEADYSESYSGDSLLDCSASYPESFDLRPVCRGVAASALLQLDDFADGLCLSLSLGVAHEVDARCQHPHIIRAGMKVQHLPTADVQ